MQGTTEYNSQSNVPDPPQSKPPESVGLRWVTAAISIPIVLALVWFGGWFSFAGVVVLIVLGTYELHTMLIHSGHHPIIAVTLGLSILFAVAAMFPQQRLILLESGLSASLLISFPLLFARKKLDGALVDWALTLAIALYLGWPFSSFLLLRGYQSGFGPGLWWTLFVLLGTWGFDSAAFFTGRLLGKHKLAPKISPSKSWEGVAGGMVLSIAAALLLTVKPLGVPWYFAVVMGIVLGVAATFGDLVESLIKRQTHVKDSGQFMPGHGGILDRIDSILFSAVVVYICAQLLGKL